MFNYIKGTLEYKGVENIIVENNGIGYEIVVSNNTLVELPEVNNQVKLLTYFQVRDDGVSLYGFYTIQEKQMFLNLITVSGIGPKIALGILSGINLSDLGVSICSGDVKTLSKVKGCGKKTAERIIVELKDKINSFGLIGDKFFESQVQTSISITNEQIDEAIDVLISLGTNKQDAISLCKKVYENNDTTEDIIQKALKGMGR